MPSYPSLIPTGKLMNPNDDITHQGPSPTLADFLTVPYSKEVITTQEYAMVAGEKILEK